MADQSELAWMRTVAQQILDGLGDRAPDWKVLDVIDAADISHEPEGLRVSLSSTFGRSPGAQAPDPGPSVLVVVGTEDGSEAGYGYFARSLPEAQAIAQLASHLQDHASEASGAPLPPCPDHQHPLSPDVVDGVAVWLCPQGPSRYRRPIVA